MAVSAGRWPTVTGRTEAAATDRKLPDGPPAGRSGGRPDYQAAHSSRRQVCLRNRPGPAMPPIQPRRTDPGTRRREP